MSCRLVEVIDRDHAVDTAVPEREQDVVLLESIEQAKHRRLTSDQAVRGQWHLVLEHLVPGCLEPETFGCNGAHDWSLPALHGQHVVATVGGNLVRLADRM